MRRRSRYRDVPFERAAGRCAKPRRHGEVDLVDPGLERRRAHERPVDHQWRRLACAGAGPGAVNASEKQKTDQKTVAARDKKKGKA